MGYVHDTAMSQWIPPSMAHLVTGTWVHSAGAVANTIALKKNQANETATVTIPIPLLSNSASYKGSKLVSIDIYWETLTLALDALSAAIYQVVLPANGDAIAAPTSLAFSYDAGHDAAGERLTLDQHKMTLTLTTPKWIDNDDVIHVQLSVDAGATSDFYLLGARANYTLRI